MGKNKGLDLLDQRIIKLLQKDGRLSNTAIAKEVGTSEGTVRVRLNRLIEEEYIQIVAVSNPLKLGFPITGSMNINVDIKKTKRVTEALKKLKPVWFVVHTTSGSDIKVEFVAKSIDDLNNLIFEKIHKIDGVVKTETSLIVNFIKRRYDWGTGF
jgi:Lrp/AsnC family transcriptional regulator for asnA, asnC and gidA